jgi:hypothetical protein
MEYIDKRVENMDKLKEEKEENPEDKAKLMENTHLFYYLTKYDNVH